MKFFDLHCDTLTKCINTKDDLKNNNLHISLDKAGCFSLWKEFFAVWHNDSLSDEQGMELFIKCSDYYKKNLTSQSGRKSYLTVENCGFIKSENDIDFLKANGVVCASLTWNAKNKLGCGCLSENDTGLTELGKRTVKKLNENNIIIDVSHISEKSFRDIANLSQKPFIATHSNFAALKKHRRNLKDDQAKFIIENGGLIGITFCRSFLPIEKSLFDGIYENIVYALDLGGENHVAIGSDFDGCFIPSELDSIEKIEDLYSYLNIKGLSEDILAKIFYINAETFLNSVCNK